MSGIDNQTERAAKVTQVIAEHPDLPMICLAPSTPSDYDSYYHDVCGASVQRMLFPLEVEKLYGDTYGIETERYFNDVDEVAEEIEDWLWDSKCGQFWDNEHQNLKCHDWVTDGWIQTYRPIARMMAEDMPWHEYIVIDCY
jgi:hypothetical protein